MGARLDGVTQRIQTAVTMMKVTMSMKGVVKGMDRAMASMNLVQVCGAAVHVALIMTLHCVFSWGTAGGAT